MKFLIIGTAGHIDHGKSSLIRSLTGTDPDRLKEEKERGITIDLGFAHMRINETEIGFVDVPGHERFVRNMLAGAGGMDAVLFVVAADESVMPQTREHLHICRLLGIERGIIVVTKIDVVDREFLPLVSDEIRSAAGGSGLKDAPVVFVSNTTGEGLEDLRKELENLSSQVTARTTHRLARLPIDRVFTMRGFGTVVTGTLHSGTLEREQTVEVLPVSIASKIRGIQTYGRKSDLAREGQRTAVNLQGVDKNLLARGMTLTVPGALKPAHTADASLLIVADAPSPLRNRDVVRLHIATQETLARVILLECDALEPSCSGLVQLRTQIPISAWSGDRFIIRRVSPATTIGGGEILNPAARKKRKGKPGVESLKKLQDASGMDRLRELILAEGQLSESVLVSFSGFPPDYLFESLKSRSGLAVLDAANRFYCSQSFLSTVGRRITETVESFQQANPLAPGIRKEELRTKLPRHLPQEIFQFVLDNLRNDSRLQLDGEYIHIAGKGSTLASEDQKLFDRVEMMLRQGGIQPPSIKELMQALNDDKRARNVIFLIQQKKIAVKIAEDYLIHSEHLARIRDKLSAQFPSGARFGVGQFKDMFGITRKHAIPLLEYFDRTRVTRRLGDLREVI
ncbi:MAG TPA: selenocysteine-specific translation elongation factor [Acidobacteriota bacterium]|jgi:selenocysteine-specific elongation factor